MEGAVAQESQIQVHCQRSLTSAFGHGLVPFMEANYYKVWSERGKKILSLAMSIHYIGKTVKSICVEKKIRC